VDAGTYEHRRPRENASVDQFDAGQALVVDDQPGHRAGHDSDAAGIQLGPLGVGQLVDVGEERHVDGPLADQQGVLHRARDGAEHPERLVSYLPTVAVRAVEQISAPPLAHAGQIRDVISDAGGDEQAPSTDARPAEQVGPEGDVDGGAHLSDVARLELSDGVVDHLDPVSGDLGATEGEQLARRQAIA
jgi:hypothetical protein